MHLLPKDEKFYDYFLEQADILRKAAKLLADQGNSSFTQIAALEKDGDKALRDTFDRLGRTFITPIDPEDVGNLTVGMEEILDRIEAFAFRLCAYQVDPFPSAAKASLGKLSEAANRIHTAFQILRDKDMKGKDEIRGQCDEIRKLTEEVITGLRDAVVTLFNTEKDCILLMKTRELYEGLEATAKQVQQFTGVVQSVIAKNI